jgi:hypothetical protein
MAGGNKKHKRGSIPSQSSEMSVSPKKELIERTADNDYGVLSDPDEQTTSTIPPTHDTTTPLPTNHETETSIQKNSPSLSPSSPHHSPASNGLECIDNQDELLPALHSSQHSSPQMSPLSPSQPLSTQPPISQSPTSTKSLDTLNLKLTRDKNFSQKITLHTFFSYIILAIDIERLSRTESTIARVSVPDVETLIEYMIENHSESEEIRNYLHTLRATGVIKNLIEAIIDFNKDQTNALDKLLISEQIELEMAAPTSGSASAAAPETSIQSLSSTPAPQTPQRCGFFKRLRCFLSGCCG